MLMFTRSMLHSMNATKHRETTVHRRFHLEAALAGFACASSNTQQLGMLLRPCMQSLYCKNGQSVQPHMLCRRILCSLALPGSSRRPQQ